MTVQRELNFNDSSLLPTNNSISNPIHQPCMSFKGIIKRSPQNMNKNKFIIPQIYPYQSQLILDNRMNKGTSSTFAKKNSGVTTTNESKPNRNDNNSDGTFDLKINLENIIIGNDKRTILMIRNVPNKYTLSNLVDEINTNFFGKYDYINLPVDPERKLNLGYAFINFVDPHHIVLFYHFYFNKKWNKYRSDKVIYNFNYIYIYRKLN